MNQQTVFDNVALPLCAKGVSRRRAKTMVEEQLERLGILELKNKYPNQISGGQKQRVAIARALVTEAKVLLADEPTGALDSKTSREVLTFLQQIHEDGNTIVLITHDNSIALEAQRVVRLKDGKIIFDGPSEEYRKVQVNMQ